MRKIYTVEDEPEIIKEYLAGASLEKIRLSYVISSTTIRKMLIKHGIERRSAGESARMSFGRTIDVNSFSNFETDLSQYYYGLMLADGSVRGNTVTFCIKDTDSELLYGLQEFMGMNYGLHFSSAYDNRTDKTYHRCVFAFSEKKITDRLRSQGLLPRKSGRETLPNFNWLESRHFWRGMLDGDGHIRLKRHRALVLVGSSDIVNGFISFCEHNKLLDTPRKASSKFYKNIELFKVQLTGDDAERVARFIYRVGDRALSRKLSAVLDYKTKLPTELT